MNNKLMSFIKPAIVLLAIAAIVALVLGCISLVTSGRIEKLAEEKMNQAMQAVLPAESYTAVADVSGFECVDAIYQAGAAGWVVQITETGSQGAITMMVGVDNTYTCTGISITEHSETAGLGAIAGQASDKGDAFRAQFVGQSGTVAVTKSGGTIDAIAGATITSNAVCQGVTDALEACRALGGAAVAAPAFMPASAEPAAPAAQTTSVEPATASVG